jgi:hypothetical protein
MKKHELNKKQLLAALVSNYQELEAIFSVAGKTKKITDSLERKARILEDLKYLITKEFGFKMSTSSIEELYHSID